MPEVAFIAPRLAAPLAELIDTLRYELERQGVPSTIAEEFPAPRADLVYVLVDPRTYMRQNGQAAVPDAAVLRRTIALGSERPESIPGHEQLDLLRGAGAVFDVDDRTVAAMRRLGLNARPLNPGYSRSRDHYDPEAQRPFDVLFLGSGTRRQTELLSRFTPLLERRNCLLRFTDEREGGPSILGPDRWSLIARSKILLNLHADESPYFETLHAFDAIHAGAVVVSEHASGLGALEPGRDLLVGAGESLPFIVDSLLGDEERLARIRADAYERLRSWLPFALSTSIFRAAIVEVLGAPLHAGVSLGRRGVVAEPEPEPDDSDVGRELELQRRIDDGRRELRALRGEVVGLRREAALLKRSIGAGASVQVEYRSPGWSARREPTVTVVMTALDGDTDTGIVETLGSVGRSRIGGWELVVVVASSSGTPLQTAARWARSNPRLATTVVADRGAVGRGAARNTGLDIARGAFTLVLDPGATIRAHCMRRLAEVLAAIDDVTFVYPMIDVAGDLLNTREWDPGRLHDGNPIHAPYLIRTAALRALGGFATDVGLDGFEDYDLWARIAERGGRGQLLAQVLAERSESPGASGLTTIMPSDGPATRALVSRAPQTSAGAFVDR